MCNLAGVPVKEEERVAKEGPGGGCQDAARPRSWSERGSLSGVGRGARGPGGPLLSGGGLRERGPDLVDDDGAHEQEAEDEEDRAGYGRDGHQ